MCYENKVITFLLQLYIYFTATFHLSFMIFIIIIFFYIRHIVAEVTQSSLFFILASVFMHVHIQILQRICTFSYYEFFILAVRFYFTLQTHPEECMIAKLQRTIKLQHKQNCSVYILARESSALHAYRYKHKYNDSIA